MSLSPAAAVAPLGACVIRGAAVVTARLTEIPLLARQPAPAGAPALPARFLRHADEQTVVGLQAVLRTLGAGDPAHPRDLTGDAVVAASCRAGQLTAARTMVGLERQGPVGVTPHVVPQCSLHSLASAVSVALGMHGPNIGVAGGPAAIREGLMAASTLAMTLTAPAAIWLIVTGWDDQPCLDDEATPQTDPTCRSLALCLQAVPHGSTLPQETPHLVMTQNPQHATEDRPFWEHCERLTQGRTTAVDCGRGLHAVLRPGINGFGVQPPSRRQEAA